MILRIAAIVLAWTFFILPAQAATQSFHTWLADLRQEAIASGISSSLVHEALPDTLEVNERILRFDRRQPESTISFEQYKKNVLTPARIREGRELMRKHAHLLHEIGKTYGVDPEYIVALWGIETNFGKNTGGFEIIPALATMAYDGRRSAFFRDELLKALKIVDEGHIPLHQMKGSWAGAMGQCQFMPSSFIRYAQDYNGDGRRDIWNTKADVFASAAAYLGKSGWRRGEAWGHHIILPKDFDNKLLGINVQKKLHVWKTSGLRLANGNPLPGTPDETISIMQPGGEGYKAYAVYNNYRIITLWNKSSYFATTVAMFADQLK